jgi:hypothetical protein
VRVVSEPERWPGAAEPESRRLRERPAWLEWCTAIVDRCFGFELREEELKTLLGKDRRRD